MHDKSDALRQSIVEEVHKLALEPNDALEELAALSTTTQVDSVETFGDEIRIDGKNFEGPILWYVTLRYGEEADDLTTSEMFRGKFEGHFEDDRPVVDRFSADASFLFE